MKRGTNPDSLGQEEKTHGTRIKMVERKNGWARKLKTEKTDQV